MKPIIIFLILALIGPALAQCQSKEKVDLMALKKQEEERRKKAPDPKYQLNDSNVKEGPPADSKTSFSVISIEKEGEAKPENQAGKDSAADSTTAGKPADGAAAKPTSVRNEEWRKKRQDLMTKIEDCQKDIAEYEETLHRTKMDMMNQTDMVTRGRMQNTIDESSKMLKTLNEELKKLKEQLSEMNKI